MYPASTVLNGKSLHFNQVKFTVLLFSFVLVYPVVNGHVNQRHVYLDVDRMGHLSCVKKNADAGSTLVWVVDPTLHDKIMFESNIVISNNSDGTVNINKTFDYEVRDHSLDRIPIECRIIETDADEHLLATRVDLLFQNGEFGEKYGKGDSADWIYGSERG